MPFSMLSFTFSLCCSCFAFSAVASPNGFYVLRKAFPVVYRTSSHVEIEAEGSFSDLSVGDINLNVTVASSSLEKKSSDPLRCERFLVLNRDYTIEKEANVLILGLLQNSRTLEEIRFPAFLVLRSVYFLDMDGINVLEPKGPLFIAKVLETPTVDCNLDAVNSDDLVIRGSAFTMDLKVFFEPAIERGVVYTIIALSPHKALLRLIPGKRWREGTGSLVVTFVDTGAGKVQLNGPHGVVVATVA